MAAAPCTKLPRAKRHISVALQPVARAAHQGLAGATAALDAILALSPSAALAFLQSCCADNDPLWAQLFTVRFAQRLSGERSLGIQFLRLFLRPGNPQHGAIVQRYLRDLTTDGRVKLVGPLAVRRPGHPVRAVVTGALHAADPAQREQWQELLRILLAHGLPHEVVAELASEGGAEGSGEARVTKPLSEVQASLTACAAPEAIQATQARAQADYLEALRQVKVLAIRDVTARLLACPLPVPVNVVIACARDNHWLWQTLLAGGLADMIVAAPDTARHFLHTLCSRPGLPYAAEVVAGYLQCAEGAAEQLFEPAALRKKVHPVNVCFCGASFTGAAGPHLLRVLQVFVAYGLPLDITLQRNSTEIQRAASLVHTGLLRLVAEGECMMPESVLRSVMLKSQRSAEGISFLVDECRVPLDRFLNPKLFEKAPPPTRTYLNARRARCSRIPESIVAEEDDDELESFAATP